MIGTLGSSIVERARRPVLRWSGAPTHIHVKMTISLLSVTKQGVHRPHLENWDPANMEQHEW